MRGINIGFKALLLGWCLSLVACEQKSGEQPTTQKDTTHTQVKQEGLVPADFAFVITNTIDSINSKGASLTRRYINTDSCITFPLSQQEMKLIHQAYLAHGLDKLDPDTDMDCQTNTLPTFYVHVSLMLNGKTKRYTYNDDFECADTTSSQYVRQVGDFLYFVRGIINQKEAVKQLSRTNMVFM